MGAHDERNAAMAHHQRTRPVTRNDVAEQARNPDAVRKALRVEREARREADRTAAELREQVETLLADLHEAELQFLRLETALDAGLPRSAADRLLGSTREELEADAAELLRHVPTTPSWETPRP
jgi:hypothetical protein